jgi:hypothetical protein
MSPTGRTLDLLRRSNYVADVVERFIQPKGNRAGFRKDFLSFADIIAARPGDGVMAIQATTLSHLSHRLVKAKRQPALSRWLKSGARFECWGWFRSGGRWKVRRVPILPGESEPLISLPVRRGKRPVQRGLFDGPCQVTK